MFVPNNTAVAIVGDFNTADVIQEIKSLTADWKKGQIDLPVLPKVEKPAQFEQKIISLPHAAQLHLFLGHVGIRRDNPDYYKLLVMDYVLGVGPGFTDRLSSRLRDRNGLAYSVGADIHSSATEQPGMFICHIGADPKNFDKVKSLLLEEINKFITAKPEAHEVEGAKQYLTGNLPFKSSTGDRLAAELLEIERYHLGENYLRDYERAVEAVTVDDVFEVAKKYLDPSHMILVAAGAIDEDGKPLAKEPDKPLAKEPDKP
jgi:zinc protease